MTTEQAGSDATVETRSRKARSAKKDGAPGQATGGGALERGLRLLEALAQGPLSFAAWRSALSIPPASFARMARSLSTMGYVTKGEDGLYRLGLRLGVLARAAMRTQPLTEAAQAALHDLREVTEETAELVRYEDDGFVFLARLESPRSIVLRAEPGSRFKNMPENAIGQLALAHGLHGAKGAIPAEQAEAIRRCGCHDMIQNEGEAWRVAAPIFEENRLIGALCVAAPAYRIDEEARQRNAMAARDHADQVTAALSLRPRNNGARSDAGA